MFAGGVAQSSPCMTKTRRDKTYFAFEKRNFVSTVANITLQESNTFKSVSKNNDLQKNIDIINNYNRRGCPTCSSSWCEQGTWEDSMFLSCVI